MATSTGRGRGRGRGVLKPGIVNSPGVPPSQENQQSDEKEASQAVDTLELLKSLDKGDLTANIKHIVDTVKQQNSQKFIDDLVNSAKTLVLKDSDSAESLAALCDVIWNTTISDGVSIKASLARTVQTLCKERSDIQKAARKQFRGVCAFTCELYKVLRVMGAPLIPFGAACYDLLDELLVNEPTIDDLLCFENCLPKIGALLEKQDQGKMDTMMDILREKAVDPDTNIATRCILVQMIELHAGGWKMESDVKRFYVDTLTDTLASGIANM